MSRYIRVLYVFFLLGTTWAATAPPGGRSQQKAASRAKRSFVLEGGVPEYKIGHRDLLKITVWTGLKVEETKVRVAEDGTVFVPFGVNRNLKAEGRSSSQLKKAILQELSRYFKEATVQVVVEEFRSSRAYLLGEIQGIAGTGAAGYFPLRGRKSILEFIIENGGFTAKANIHKVQVMRSTGQQLVVDLSAVIFQGNQQQNIIINPGDVVFVPSAEVGAHRYFVFGEVRKPGIVSSQVPLNLVETISKSGSFTADADREKVYIARGDPAHPEIHMLNMRRLTEQADFSQNVALRDQDIVFVPRRGLAKFRDVMNAIQPIASLVRDTVFIFTQ